MLRLQQRCAERPFIRRGASLGLAAAAVSGPALALAHERWVPHGPRFPINRAYFQSMTGEVLLYSAGAGVALLSILLFWYLWALPILEELTPITASARAREAQRSAPSRAARSFVRFILDGDVESRFMERGLAAGAFVFDRLPALVLVLGVFSGWLLMPSFPIRGDLGPFVRVVAVALAVWVASGAFRKPLGGAMLFVFGYLCFEYGIVAVDAVPVLASAFFYLFSSRPAGPLESRPVQAPSVNSRQLMGMRCALGAGFFLLGLINKIYLAEIFIGVGDQHPSIVAGPQAMFPGLTREAWAFTTALGEMVFGLLLLTGVFNRLTTLVLALVFANFIVVFGWAEIVHLYPIAGFALLFFRGTAGTALDGLIFRANLQFWRRLHHRSSRVIYGSAVSTIAALVTCFFLFFPLVLIVEAIPVLAGTAVPLDYQPPPPAPPATAWASVAGSPSGSASLVPHSDHEPRHGGVVTMAGDLHVEVVVQGDGTILLYLSDAIRAPIDPAEARGTVQIARGGDPLRYPLTSDPSGALLGVGPIPTEPADYTYALHIRGVFTSMTIAVPAGGTRPLVERPREAR